MKRLSRPESVHSRILQDCRTYLTPSLSTVWGLALIFIAVCTMHKTIVRLCKTCQCHPGLWRWPDQPCTQNGASGQLSCQWWFFIKKTNTPTLLSAKSVCHHVFVNRILQNIAKPTCVSKATNRMYKQYEISNHQAFETKRIWNNKNIERKETYQRALYVH